MTLYLCLSLQFVKTLDRLQIIFFPCRVISWLHEAYTLTNTPQPPAQPHTHTHTHTTHTIDTQANTHHRNAWHYVAFMHCSCVKKNGRSQHANATITVPTPCCCAEKNDLRQGGLCVRGQDYHEAKINLKKRYAKQSEKLIATIVT